MRCEWKTDNPPEEISEYLVTYTHGGLGICTWTDKDHWGTSRWHWATDAYSSVMAWMPLPAEYNGSHWYLNTDTGRYHCDNCDNQTDVTKEDYDTDSKELPKFCSNCGAKMDV